MRISLTLYFRQGCHLCEDMATHLQALQSELDFEIKPVDIDLDDRLRARYHSAVPVLMLETEELCRYFMNEVAVRQALAAELLDV